jgi:hypothetical protein
MNRPAMMTEPKAFTKLKKSYKELLSIHVQDGLSRLTGSLNSFFVDVCTWLMSALRESSVIEIKGKNLALFNELVEMFDRITKPPYRAFFPSVEVHLIQKIISFFAENVDRKGQEMFQPIIYTLLDCLLATPGGVSFAQKTVVRELDGAMSTEMLPIYQHVASLPQEEFLLWCTTISHCIRRCDHLNYEQVLMFLAACCNNGLLVFSENPSTNVFLQGINQAITDSSQFTVVMKCIEAISVQVLRPEMLLVDLFDLLGTILRVSQPDQIPSLVCLRRFLANCSMDETSMRAVTQCFLAARAEADHEILHFMHLFYLLDVRCAISGIWKEAFDLAECSAVRREELRRFVAYFAALTFVSLFDVSVDALKEFLKMQPGAKASFEKTLGGSTAVFIEKLGIFLEAPWNFVTSWLTIPTLNFSPNQQFSRFDFDRFKPENRPLLTAAFAKAAFPLNSIFLATILASFQTILELLPPRVPVQNRNVLVSLFFGDALKILTQALRTSLNSDTLTLLTTTSSCFAKVTLRLKLQTAVFAKWTQIIAQFSLCEDPLFRIAAIAAVCDSMRLMLPGSELLLPLLILYVRCGFQNRPQEAALVTPIANALASALAYSEWIDSSRIISYLQNYPNNLLESLKPFPASEIPAVLVEFYDKVSKFNRNDIFASIIQAALTSQSAILQDWILAKVPQLTDETEPALRAFIPFCEQFAAFIPRLIAALIDHNRSDSALEFFIATEHCCNVKNLINPFLAIASDSQKLRLLHDFLRYPFPFGPGFCTSAYDIHERGEPFRCFTKTGGFLMALRHGPESCDVSIVSRAGSGSVRVRRDEFTHSTSLIQPPPIHPEVLDNAVFWEQLQPLTLDLPISVPDQVPDPRVPEGIDKPPVDRANDYFMACALEQLGLLDESSLSLVNDSHVQLESRAVSGISYRIPHKIGLLSVGEGQRDQKSILANSAFSPLFLGFAERLGYIVDMKTHCGTAGGLDTKTCLTGNRSLYYADQSHEVMFHVPQFLATRETDPQNVYKKRHIGNDCVHVILSEDSEEYKTTMIVSQFNCAHIVVYPLGGRLFDVHVFAKPEIPWFGPLCGRSVVGEQFVAELVRLTAIMADDMTSVQRSGKMRSAYSPRLEEAIANLKNGFVNPRSALSDALMFG